MPRALLFGAAVVAFTGGAWAALSPEDAALSLLLVAVALIAFGFAWLESGPGSAKEVALVAVLGGVAAAGRVLFTAVPGVQPVTVVAVAAGAALGARVGFAVGAVAALVSNFYLGQGIWTPWQMLAWGGCGVAGALAAGLIRNRWAFAALCFALGFAFSSAMDLWYWYSFWPHTWEALVAVLGRGVWFSAAHAVGNVVFALAIGPELRRLLERYGRRLRVEIAWGSRPSPSH
jgi:energy-coupling factor transport system substrate-specific component